MELFLREKHGVLLQQTVDIVLKVLDTPGVCPSLEEYLLAAKDTLKGESPALITQCSILVYHTESYVIS